MAVRRRHTSGTSIRGVYGPLFKLATKEQAAEWWEEVVALTAESCSRDREWCERRVADNVRYLFGYYEDTTADFVRLLLGDRLKRKP